ncbi:Hypothetical protein CINCED_3A003335 [Cinara cedri]|uniref:Uncharacterized protein n=1 Tax=Cinara cedri TaxID=506608 RepID=A0A5E4M5E1_9HEMI|nr:Hypothetical protein CINCED_3A003335 [Cinara cedri]
MPFTKIGGGGLIELTELGVPKGFRNCQRFLITPISGTTIIDNYEIHPTNLLNSTDKLQSTCDLLNCGYDICSGKETPCLIESAATPFTIRVQFGPGDKEENPDDNLGVCIRYQQQKCSP